MARHPSSGSCRVCASHVPYNNYECRDTTRHRSASRVVCEAGYTSPPAASLTVAPKPKRSLWQTLFGDRKCAFCCKKKRNCSCDKICTVCTKKKRECCCALNRQSICCRPVVTHGKSAFENRKCRCKYNNSTRRTFGRSENSIGGCSFYFNIDRRARRQTGKREACFVNHQPDNGEQAVDVSCKTPVSDATCEIPVCDDGSPKKERLCHSTNYGHRSTMGSDKKSSCSTTGGTKDRASSSIDNCPEYEAQSQQKKETIDESFIYQPHIASYHESTCEPSNVVDNCKDSRKPLSEHEQPNCNNDLHIDIRVTRDQTTILQNKDGVCKTVAENHNEKHYSIIKPIENESGNESSDKLVTLEIFGSGVSFKQDEENVKKHDYENDEKNSNNPPSLTKYYHSIDTTPRSSESMAREIRPLMDKRFEKSISHTRSVDEENESLYQRKYKTSSSKLSRNRNLEKTVSEILKKLDCIDGKLNTLNRGVNQCNEDFKIELDDDSKSTAHYRYKVSENGKSNENNIDYCSEFNNKDSHKTSAFIEIRHTKSKKQSGVRKYSKQSSSSRNSQTLIHESYNSQSLDDFQTKASCGPKIVIKIPTTSHKYSIDSNDAEIESSPHKGKLDKRITWCNVSNELKRNSCLCYECMCKRKL